MRGLDLDHHEPAEEHRSPGTSVRAWMASKIVFSLVYVVLQLVE